MVGGRMLVSLNIWAFFLHSIVLPRSGKCLNEVLFRREEGKHLPGRVIQTEHTNSELECSLFCSREESCLSVNYKHTGDNKGLCELNDEALSDPPENGPAHPEFNYLGVVQRNCRDKHQIFSQKTKKCESLLTCKEMFDGARSSLDNGVYKLRKDDFSQQYTVYCHMAKIPGCGGGGWTLVIKTDGKKQTFNYSASYWSDKKTYQVQEGLEGLTEKESKLASYWNTPFTKICLGMKVNGVSKWIKLDYEASSLYSVIAGGTFQNTTAGRTTWKSLISDSSLQQYCDKEGFNIEDNIIRMRLGTIANDVEHCWHTGYDSFIGFGVSSSVISHKNIVTGNVATWTPDNGYKDTTAFGYILVQ